MSHYLLIGLGSIGLNVANGLAALGEKVTAVSRSAKPALDAGITHLQVDARKLAISALGTDGQTISHLCIIVSPDTMSEQGYYDSYYAISQHLITLSQHLPRLQRVVYVSSTGVYGQDQGERVDITTPIQPPSQKTSQVLWATEQLLQQHFQERCTLIRASGIYGADRRRLLNLVKKIAAGEPPPRNTWTNRIMDSDLISIIIRVLQQPLPLPIYLATDRAPVSLYEVLRFLAQAMDLSINLPQDMPTTGKQIFNNLPKDWLQYPSYQQGYQAILNHINTKTDQ